MTTEPPTQQAVHTLWTIARICRTLNHPVLERRFLQDLTHAPEPEVMKVFTAWQTVATTIERRAAAGTVLEALALPESGQTPPAEGR